MKHQDFSAIAFEGVHGKRAKASAFYTFFGKRAFDLVVSVMLLPGILAILAIVWLLKAREGSTFLFGQQRVGKNGVLFTCYKIQTMVDNADDVLAQLCAADPEVKAEWDKYQKLERDPRITRLGHLLRKTSIDELPQIFNVLKGDMSLVGPRPFMVEQQELYQNANGWTYYTVRPGITGEWQVNGRGATSFVARVAYDNRYYRRMSFRTDLRLIFGTVGAVLNMSGR